MLIASVGTHAESKIYFVHNDHLNTAQVITDENQTVVWEVESQTPFGVVDVNEDPDQDGNLVEFNLRFPGQYYDVETGLNYNYYRTYDPSLGRYIQSDPIGLAGGINTYGYVYQNPLRYYDPYGLESRGWFTAGSVANESKKPIPVVGDDDNGKKIVGVVPGGTPKSPGLSPSDFDWDFAWINCKCIKIGMGELDIGEDGSPKSGQLEIPKLGYVTVSDSLCTSMGMSKPEACDNCQ